MKKYLVLFLLICALSCKMVSIEAAPHLENMGNFDLARLHDEQIVSTRNIITKNNGMFAFIAFIAFLNTSREALTKDSREPASLSSVSLYVVGIGAVCTLIWNGMYLSSWPLFMKIQRAIENRLGLSREPEWAGGRLRPAICHLKPE